MDSDALLNLDRDLPVTPEDVEALRRLRAEVPSWFSLDWRTLDDLVGPNGVAGRSPGIRGRRSHWSSTLDGIQHQEGTA